ncbi:putative inorganic carbon transporter subunit DabA, partial [Bacillus xiapuensis]|nr:Na-translocating system protein MpsB [Bacillus xiapuensis]
MSTTLTLAKSYSLENELYSQNLNDLVKAASEVIAPLGPITTFAARNPWMGLEQQPFEEVARRLKDVMDVDIYPNNSILQSARDRGEIRHEFLDILLQQWLDSQTLGIPRDVAERFCRAALSMEPSPSKALEGPELKKLVKKASHLRYQINGKRAVKTFSQRLKQQGNNTIAKDLNRHMIKWCKLFLDESQAVWSMPSREDGFYQAWQRLIKFDPALKSTLRKHLNDGPEKADDALMKALLELEIPFSEVQEYLEAHLLALPGWAGMMLWRSQQSSQEDSLLQEYLAVRVSMESALMKPYLPLAEQKIEDKDFLEPLVAAWVQWGDMPISLLSQLSATELKAHLTLAYRFDQAVRQRLWLEAWEKTYEDQIMKLITSKQLASEKKENPVMAQVVFCIDVRSEPFRRKLEQEGPFETFGAAGFFGLPIETTKLGSGHSHDSLPVMFKPQMKVKETSSELEFEQYLQRDHAAKSLSTTFKTMKHNLPSSLILPEISGPWLGLQTLARSFIPRRAGSAFRKIKKTWLHKPSTKLSLDHEHTLDCALPVGFTDTEKVYYVRQALKMMGLTKHFAPLVVICGHGSHSTNNPYSSSLDCGACGGTSSGFNARVLAALC